MNEIKANSCSMPQSSRPPWSVDRFGRLIAGLSITLFTMMSILHSSAWLWVVLFCACNLLLTALTDRCVVRALLLMLGAKEREDLFLPGGLVKPRGEKIWGLSPK